MEVDEQTWRDSSDRRLHRPLPDRLEVRCRQKSLRLQRVLTDFGLDESFERASAKVREHYGLEIGASGVREGTLQHARAVESFASETIAEPFRALPVEGADHLICEGDGSFLRLVKAGLPRKGKRPREWKEVRVVAAQDKGSSQACYAASFGTPEEIGRCWAMAAHLAGWALNTKVHGLGDGAEWIPRQLREIFGAEADYLIDFYHLMEYLSAAAGTVRPGKEKNWLRTQKRRLKKGQSKKVIAEVQKHLEAADLPDEEAPVRCAWRYMTNRTGCFDYHTALEKELPIGSGMIESAHGHLIQSRLKRNGMVWIMENAESIVQLRVHRANGQWAKSWEKRVAA